jgi:hypothetical protein
MPLMHCPHCGAENFTMEGWEDLDHCSSCGKPLGESEGSPVDAANGNGSAGKSDRLDKSPPSGDPNAENPRPA